MKALLLLLLHAGAAAAWRCDGEAQSETPTALPYFSLAAASELAICNDGSAAGYYFRASPSGSPLWLVYLAGGAWCSSPEDCAARWEGSVYPNHDCRLPAGQLDQRCFMSSKEPGLLTQGVPGVLQDPFAPRRGPLGPSPDLGKVP